MERTVTVISLIASLITIGDMLFKIAFKDSYDYTTSISLILVIVVLQLAFYYLLDLKITEKESYISLVYFALIPVIISISGWGFYKSASLDPPFGMGLEDIFSESFKAGLLIIITVGLFLFWSKATKSKTYKNSNYLSFAFGIPSVVIFLLATYRYTFNNQTLDVHFFGFILLLLITIILAAIVKSTFTSDLLSTETKALTKKKDSFSTKRLVLAGISIMCIAYAGISGHWMIALIIAVVTIAVAQPQAVEKIIDDIG